MDEFWNPVKVAQTIIKKPDNIGRKQKTVYYKHERTFYCSLVFVTPGETVALVYEISRHTGDYDYNALNSLLLFTVLNMLSTVNNSKLFKAL